jgi:hypothetical protein
MVFAERLLVSTSFIMYYRHQSVSHPTKINIYIALQNENKRQLTMPYGGRKRKRHSLQAGILKNCDEYCKMVLYDSTFSCFNDFTARLVSSILNMQINSFYKYLKIKL